MKSTVEQVRDLIASPSWVKMDDAARYTALNAIEPECDYYQVSYCPTVKKGRFAYEDYPALEEAVDRAAAIVGGAETIYAGTYVQVIDGGGNQYFESYCT